MNRTIASVGLAAALLFPSVTVSATSGEEPLHALKLSSALSLGLKQPVKPDTIPDLQRKLSAQQAINEQLRQRIVALESQLGPAAMGREATGGQSNVAKDRVVDERASAEARTAIERALGSKGLVLLSPGAARATPGFVWEQGVSSAREANSYVGTLLLEAGIPFDAAVSLRLPYVSQQFPGGANSGLGDASVSVARQFGGRTLDAPAVVTRLTYTHDTGAAPDRVPAVGGGSQALEVSLSAIKPMQPAVLYGSVFYYEARGRTGVTIRDAGNRESFSGRIDPGSVFGGNAGVSLAVTPELSLDAGFSLFQRRGTNYVPNVGAPFFSPRQQQGYVSLGAGLVVSRNLFFALSVAAGVTREASDAVVFVSLPYRF